MSWNRQTSNLEGLMVAALKKKKALSLQEVVEAIQKKKPDVFTGKTPRNSLYSIIYRREKNRLERGNELLFMTERVRGEVVYSLNPDCTEIV
ncbi:HTH domain-containing protein [Achromobacter sp.]|uniref:HTH domain-containing protein n=1 Tax=Achromobacter sp. TaxID=134375 RepID=UPI00289CDFB0|nr:HTH domain-containing protein [Achromobacter sp.]